MVAEKTNVKINWFGAVVGLLLVVALAAAIVSGYRYFEARSVENARNDALSAARDYASTMFAYKADNIDDHVARSQKFVSGDAAAQYNDWVVKPKYADQVKRDNITSAVSIQEAGVVQNTRDSATVLLFVNQSVSRGQKQDVRMDPSRVKFDMTRRDGVWKIESIEVITDDTLQQVISKDKTPPPGATTIPLPSPTPTS